MYDNHSSGSPSSHFLHRCVNHRVSSRDAYTWPIWSGLCIMLLISSSGTLVVLREENKHIVLVEGTQPLQPLKLHDKTCKTSECACASLSACVLQVWFGGPLLLLVRVNCLRVASCQTSALTAGGCCSLHQPAADYEVFSSPRGLAQKHMCSQAIESRRLVTWTERHNYYYIAPNTYFLLYRHDNLTTNGLPPYIHSMLYICVLYPWELTKLWFMFPSWVY